MKMSPARFNIKTRHSTLSAGLLLVSALGVSSPSAAQTTTPDDVQYASYVLLCEGRYQAKGTPDDVAFWQELRADLTEGELKGAQGAMGSVAGTLSQINDSIVVKRCEEFRDAFENPDDFVEDASPELQAAGDRVQALVGVLVSELAKSRIGSDYIDEVMTVAADISNEVEDELERANWIELYFQKIIFGLREQTKALSAAQTSGIGVKGWRHWSAVCAKRFSSTFSEDVIASIAAGDFAESMDQAQMAILLERLHVVAHKNGLQAADNLSLGRNVSDCRMAGNGSFNLFVEAPAKAGRVKAEQAIKDRK